MKCEQEMCSHWSGDGCACAVLGLEPDVLAAEDARAEELEHYWIERYGL